MPKNFDVSMVIRTRDEEKLLWKLLENLISKQTIKSSEIIIIDNYSCKKEFESLKDKLCSFEDQMNFHIIMEGISDKEFSHPYQTNLGVYKARCDYIAMTNAHSLPISNTWLEDGLNNFKDPDVVGVSGYCLPYYDSSDAEKIAYGITGNLMKFTNLKLVYKGHFALSLLKAFPFLYFFSTTNCILKRKKWEERCFDEKIEVFAREHNLFPECEDRDWGMDMLARGDRQKIIIDPKFNVFHSHEYSFPKIFKKHVHQYRINRVLDKKERPREAYTRLV